MGTIYNTSLAHTQARVRHLWNAAFAVDGRHDSTVEGAALGFIVATGTWLWIALIDATVGAPFHTFVVLGGVAGFTALHYAFLNDGFLVQVPANVEVAEPVRLVTEVSGDGLTTPHTLIVTGANSRVTVVHEYRSSEDANSPCSHPCRHVAITIATASSIDRPVVSMRSSGFATDVCNGGPATCFPLRIVTPAAIAGVTRSV